MAIGLTPLQLPVFADPREDALLRLLLRQPRELSGLLTHSAVRPDHRGLRKLVVAPDFEVQGVVGGRHLEGAGAELDIDPFVGDHGHVTFDEGHDHLPPDGVAPAVVVWVHRHRNIAEDRRRAGRRNRHAALTPVGKRITDVGEGIVNFLVHELEIGKRSLVKGAPVDDPVRAVDPSLSVEVHEVAHDGADVGVVHREPLAPVVHRRPHPPELAHDRAPVGVEPLPDELNESLAAQLLARLPF